MSQTDAKKLKGLELGRVVRLLRREFEPDEIRAILERGYRRTTWREAEFEHLCAPYPTRWTCKLIDEHVLAFARRHGRWPNYRDWGRPNHLPSRKLFLYHDNPQHWCRYEWRGRYVAPAQREPHPTFWQRMAARDDVGIDLILRIPNQVFRRDAVMAWGGPARMAQEGKGHVTQQDDYGKLWRINYVEPNVGDWFSLFVEVVNSTPRMKEVDGEFVLDLGPDGELVFDHYFLRVPPHMKTAQEAVAWTGHFDGPNRMEPLRLNERVFEGFVAQS